MTAASKPSEELTWVKTASNNAMLSKDEVMAWMKLDATADLRALIRDQSFPKPKFGMAVSCRLSSKCRWRVGSIRAWLAAQEAADAH